MRIALDRRRPLAEQIYDGLRGSILEGDLAAETRLPPTRELAVELRVSRNTVLGVYARLCSEGFAEGRTGVGTFVAAALPADLSPQRRSRVRAERSRVRLSSFGRRAARQWREPVLLPAPMQRGLRYHFRLGVPDGAAFPHDAWRRISRRAGRERSRHFLEGLAPEGVFGPFREALAAYLLRRRGLECDPERILVFNGTQHTLDLVMRVLVDPGDRVAIEDPHDTATRRTLLAAGARLAPVPVDAQGMVTSRLPRPTARTRLAMATPSLQFPTGARLPVARRLELLDWAERADAYVIDGAYDAEFHFDGRAPESLLSLDRGERVIYVESLIKVMSPVLDVAFLVLPRALVDPFRRAKFLIDRHTPSLQHVMTEFLNEGHYERHVRRLRRRLEGRRLALREAVHRHLGERAELQDADGGLHDLIWLRDMRPAELDRRAKRAADAGVGVYPISPCYLGRPERAGLLLGFVSLTEREIQTGIRRLASFLR